MGTAIIAVVFLVCGFAVGRITADSNSSSQPTTSDRIDPAEQTKLITDQKQKLDEQNEQMEKLVTKLQKMQAQVETAKPADANSDAPATNRLALLRTVARIASYSRDRFMEHQHNAIEAVETLQYRYQSQYVESYQERKERLTTQYLARFTQASSSEQRRILDGLGDAVHALKNNKRLSWFSARQQQAVVYGLQFVGEAEFAGSQRMTGNEVLQILASRDIPNAFRDTEKRIAAKVQLRIKESPEHKPLMIPYTSAEDQLYASFAEQIASTLPQNWDTINDDKFFAVVDAAVKEWWSQQDRAIPRNLDDVVRAAE